MFRLSRNHHQASYNYSTNYILACAYIMGSHAAYSDSKIQGAYKLSEYFANPYFHKY
jgi:hypothetical protein